MGYCCAVRHGPQQKLGIVTNIWGELIGFLDLASTSLALCVLERSVPHRQCWEQERTTCSGGWVNANNCGNPQMLKMCKY